jgi:ribonucleoside-diphosphate reductase alpha chain
LISKNALELLSKRYCRNGEQPDNVYKRTAEVLSNGDKKLEERLLDLFIKGIFLVNSPALFNSSYSNMFHACCVLPIEDNMESIAQFRYEMTIMFKHGAGVGTNFSKLRAKDSPLSNGGTSSGIVSLLKAVNQDVDYVKQGGYRRGAVMSILNHDHPEIYDFVMAKLRGGLDNMNLSVMVTDKFMEKAETNDLFDVISFCAWACGCPGLLFFDRINKDNKLYPKEVITGTNPCSESPLLDNSLCTLGSINLSRLVRDGEFSWDRFEEIIEIGVKALKNMNSLGWYPFDSLRENMKQHDPIGLGVMGFADALIKLGLYYDSKETLQFTKELGGILKNTTDSLAGESFYKRIIAPTGSLSILADCSSGIEPVFADVFERNLTVGKIEETRDIYKSQYCRISTEISPEWHINVLAEWQKHIDGGVSKTINIPKEATIKDVKKAMIQAWRLGCKGITCYRDESKENQVLRRVKCSDEGCTL